jgi:hypothetical protein
MKTAAEIMDIMKHANGTEQYHRYSPFPAYPKIADGVKAVAEASGSFWFLDIIGSYQQRSKKLDPHFQVWKLLVKDDMTAVVRGYNDTTRIITQKIPFTDFPLQEYKVYLIDGIVLLPSEY